MNKKIEIKGENIVCARGINEDYLRDITISGEDLVVSDGSHTMDELYEHRYKLWIALCSSNSLIDKEMGFTNRVWRTERHSDDTSYPGYFILGVDKEAGEQITYHLPIVYWKDTNFAETLDKAPEYDGHTSADVLERIMKL